MPHIFQRFPPWLELWLMVAVIFYSMKTGVLLRTKKQSSWFAKLAFFFLWPGMNFPEFTRAPSRRLPLVRRGMINLCCGSLLVWGVSRFIGNPLAATWIAMAGFVWALHGGLFTLIAAFWRAMGRDVLPLMNAPLFATSLADFWGRRWNRAFRDAAHTFVFKPLVPRIGTLAAMACVFTISGVLHDAVVSIPARGGYGFPTFYFLLQAIGLAVENKLRAPGMKRLCAFAFLVFPLPIGYPPVFVENVCTPFFRMIGALP